ncbi:hypothetical protein NL676_023300 [Syzygium grande]|nr:hypothetical protein NL676_023300 [Syzygium grande]
MTTGHSISKPQYKPVKPSRIQLGIAGEHGLGLSGLKAFLVWRDNGDLAAILLQRQLGGHGTMATVDSGGSLADNTGRAREK